MNGCYYWWLCWYGMRLLFFIMPLRWDDVYVENDVEMKCWWCWKCVEMMHVVYVHGGVHWPCRMSLVGENKLVKEFKHLWGDDLGSLIHSWSVYLMVPTFYTLYVVYVHGGCIDLVGCPWWGKIKWLKSCLCTTGWPRYLLPCFPKWECRVDTLMLFPWGWYHIASKSWDQVHASYWTWLIGTMYEWWLFVECVLINECCISSWYLLMFSC